MIIQTDTREKGNDTILYQLEAMGHKTFQSKVYCGDYINYHNPRTIVERKKDLREIATNVTTKRATFYDELEKLRYIESNMVILITQDKIDGHKINSLEDVMLWKPKKGQGTVSGMRIYKELALIEHNYPVKVKFCSKQNAAKEIVRILGGK